MPTFHLDHVGGYRLATPAPDADASHVAHRLPRRQDCTGRHCWTCQRGIVGDGWRFRDGRAMCFEHGRYPGAP
jgi:hypothetical protein